MSDILNDINRALGGRGASNSQSAAPAGRTVTIFDEIDAAIQNKFDKPGRRFRVSKVIDGDTLDLEGFGRVRLAGVNSPETVHPTKGVEFGGPRASAFLNKLASGKDVTVSLQAGDTTDKYGRQLAAVSDDDGNIFNVELVKSGNAQQIKDIPTTAPITTPQEGRLWRSAATAAKLGLQRGILYPVSSFFSEDWKLMQKRGDRARRDLLQELDSRGVIDGAVRDKVAAAPEVVGELIGGLPANVATYGAFRSAFGVATAASMAGKAARSIAAAGASGGAISTLAFIDNGESRLARVARDTIIAGTFEIIGLPLMRKAWRAEIGDRVADEAVGVIAKEVGTTPDVVASHIDALRSGNLGVDLGIATKLSRELEKNPTAKKSILKLNADRAIADWYNDVLPSNVTIDPGYAVADPNFGARGELKVRNPATGEESIYPFHIRSNPADRPVADGGESKTKFAVETRQLQAMALQFKQNGFETKLENLHFAGGGAWTRFNRLFRSSDASAVPFESAPKGTLAARAERPQAGKNYRVKSTGKVVTAIGPEGPGGDFLWGGIEAKAAVRNAPSQELAHAAALAETRDAVLPEINNRIAFFSKNLDQIEAQSDEGLIALDSILSQADKQTPGYVAVRARLTNVMRERNVRKPTEVSTPKGIQGPLTKFEEGLDAQARGTNSNEWGVGGYKRREGSDQLVTFLRKAKAAKGQARDVRQRVRDDAKRLRDEWAGLRAQDHARVVRSAADVEEESAALAERVSAEEALPVPQGMPGYEPDKWTVKVRDDQGKVSTVTLADLYPVADIQSPRSITRPLGLKPHTDGSTRHGLVDLSGRKVVLEDFDRPSEYWRSPEATTIDEEDYLVGHTPRLFMSEKGVTLSIPNTQNWDALRGDWQAVQRVPKLGGMVEDVGPRDTIEALQHGQRAFTTHATQTGWAPVTEGGTTHFERVISGKERVTVDVGRLQSKHAQRDVTVSEEIRGRQKIRMSRTPARWYDPETQTWKTRDRWEGDFYETFAGKPDEVVAARPLPAGFIPKKAARPGMKGDYAEETHPRVLDRLPNEFEPGEVAVRPPSFAISKVEASQHLEMVTAKRAAAVLLENGADPTTPVRITVSGGRFDDVGAPYDWTLEELSKLKFGFASWDKLQAAARTRGFRAMPEGETVVLGGQAGQYRFPSGQEALEFLLRIPQGKKYGPVIEKKLLSAWAVGGPERSTDFVVDGVGFRETPLQESSITEVVTGRSPATLVKSTHGRILNGTVQNLAKQNGTAGQFAAVPISGEFSDKAHEAAEFIVYEKGAVRARINQHQAALRKIGIDPSQGEEAVMSQLARFGQGSGLHLLFGNRSGADALLYAQLRQWNQSELFRLGAVQYDSHGAYRVYTPSQRQQIAASLKENPPNPIYDPTLESRFAKAGMGSQQGSSNQQVGGPQAAPKRFQDLFAPEDSGSGSGGRTSFDMLGPIGEGGGDLRPPIGELTEFAEEEYLSSSRPFKLFDFFRVPMELFKEYQEATGIPFYRWWQTIDHGRTQVVRATHPLFNQIHTMARVLPRDERVQIGQLFELRYTDEAAYQRLKGQFPDVVQKAEGLLDSVMRKFITDLEMDPDKELKELGFFRKMNMDSTELRPYGSNRPPQPITRKSRAFSDNLPLDEREYDFAITMKRYGRALAHEKYLAQEWADIDKSLVKLSGVEADYAVERMIDFFNRHRAEAVHAQDRLGYGLAMAVRNVTKRILGVELAHDEAVDVVGTLTGANYFANMGFNIGMTARNYLQTLQTVFPIMGGADTAFGIRMALRWRKDPNIRAAMEKRDIVNTNAMLEPLSNIQQAMLESPKLAGYAKGAGKVVDFMNKGVQFYQSADDFNRVAAYYAQYNAAERAGKKFLAGKLTWPEYLVESKAEFRDTGSGELLAQVKESLARGNNELASHLLALDFAKATQFLYSRGNVPYAMQSTAGRLFGQYGTWPAWYVDWFGNHMFRRGSRSARLQVAARWAAVNATMMYGMAEVFGVDFARWSFFAPLVYTGGPLAQVAQQGLSTLSAKVSGDEDAVARIQAARLQTSAWKQFLPFPTVATTHLLESGRQLRDGNYGDAMKDILGLPDVKP